MTAAALVEDQALSKFAGRVSDSGEGRWTIHAAIDEGVPAPVLSTALYERFSSRGEADYQDKVLSAMRYKFGGHIELPVPNRRLEGGSDGFVLSSDFGGYARWAISAPILADLQEILGNARSLHDAFSESTILWSALSHKAAARTSWQGAVQHWNRTCISFESVEGV